MPPGAVHADISGMSGTVRIKPSGKNIHVSFRGELNEDLVNRAHSSIEELVERMPDCSLLVDTLQLERPPLKLALNMKEFSARLNGRVRKVATVVDNSHNSILARIAFTSIRRHTLFNDSAQALDWLAG